MGRFVTLAIFVAFLGAPTLVHAQTLLATIQGEAGGGTSGALNQDVSSVAFELGFDGLTGGAPCSGSNLGCEAIPVAQLVPNAVFTYDASNGQNFALVAARITNGADELLWDAQRMFDSSDILVAGSAGASAESIRLGVTPDLTGYVITKITVTVNSFTLGAPDQHLSYSANVTWRIYGSAATPAIAASWGALKAQYR